jgi:magnesium-transporting ATPase (P-type)
MNDNNILDQREAAPKKVNLSKIRTLYLICFSIFGLAYGFLLLIMYTFNRGDLTDFLGIEDNKYITYFVFFVLGLSILSFFTAVFFRLRYAYFSPLADKKANRKAALSYFGLAIGLFFGAWICFEWIDSAKIGSLIGLEKRGSSSEFGYFSLYLFWAFAGLYTLLSGLRFRQS